MRTPISKITSALFCACLLVLAGCGSDEGTGTKGYAGGGAVGGMGLGGNLGNPGDSMSYGGMGGSGGMSVTAGTGATAGMMAMMTGGMDGTIPPAGGGGGMMALAGGGGGMMAMTGGAGGAGGTMMTGGTGGMNTGNPNDDLDAVRQVCVDTINMYRATLDLPPLARATPEQEVCSDNGAMMDAEAMDPHGSAGMCDLGAQNTCPGYPVSFGGGTLEGVLKRCLQQMWDEGEPPVSHQQCEADYAGCFLKHGHYLNMIRENATEVGCGFYDMGNDTWWMNQNFKVVFRR